MINRRGFFRIISLASLPFLFPKFLISENCFSEAPQIEKYAGLKDKCSAYVRTVAERFGKNFNRGPAWVFAERNYSVAKFGEINKQYSR